MKDICIAAADQLQGLLNRTGDLHALIAAYIATFLQFLTLEYMDTVTAGTTYAIFSIMHDDVVFTLHRLSAIGADGDIRAGHTMGHTGVGILDIANLAIAGMGIKGVGTLVNLYFTAAIAHSPMLVLIGCKLSLTIVQGITLCRIAPANGTGGRVATYRVGTAEFFSAIFAIPCMS